MSQSLNLFNFSSSFLDNSSFYYNSKKETKTQHKNEVKKEKEITDFEYCNPLYV